MRNNASFYSKCFLAVAVSSQLAAYATALNDNFEDGFIDPALWQVGAPFSDSALFESGGYAVFQNRGRLLTASDLSEALDIQGRFRFIGNEHDNFTVALRTDGAATVPHGSFDRGIFVEFVIQNDAGDRSKNIFVNVLNQDFAPHIPLGSVGYPIILNYFVDFRITDDGTTISVYADDLIYPALVVSDSTDFGNKLGFFNRKGAGAGSVISAGSIVELDFVRVNSVPDGAEYAELLAMGFLLGVRLLARRICLQLSPGSLKKAAERAVPWSTPST